MSEPINDLPAGLYVLRRMKVTRGSALEMKKRGSYEEPGKTE